MWITRLAFDSLNAERIKTSEEARVLAHQNNAQQVTLTWALHRVEQLERERAQLLWQYVGIKVQVPVVVPVEKDPEDVLGSANLFNDIGDDAAKRLGIEWTGVGELKQ
jgi:hypothetical protein